MKKLSRMDLKDQALSRDEMKAIVAGSGGIACNYVVHGSWSGQLVGCRETTEAVSFSGSGTINISPYGMGGSISYDVQYSSSTTTKVCEYKTYDPYNIGLPQETRQYNAALTERC